MDHLFLYLGISIWIWAGKSIIHPRNLWVRGSNLTGGHNRLSCPRSADTALKPYLTFWAGKHSATWHVSGHIPIRCVSRREAGNIMMAPVIIIRLELFISPKLVLRMSSIFSRDKLSFIS